jgi:hypothetical protein
MRATRSVGEMAAFACLLFLAACDGVEAGDWVVPEADHTATGASIESAARLRALLAESGDVELLAPTACETVETRAAAPTILVSRNRPVDYGSTSIAVSDPARAVNLQDDVINSGSVAPGLTTALSGDVVLPSRPLRGQAILLIDRLYAHITALDPQGFTPLSQVSVLGAGGTPTTAPVGTYRANPHDLVELGGGEIYVTRYDADDTTNLGADIIRVNLLTGAITARIDPKPLVPPDLPAAVEGSRSRPSKLLAAMGRVFVSLGVSAGQSPAPDGLVGAIDPATDQLVNVWRLPQCAFPEALAFDAVTKSVVVLCQGSIFDDDGPTRAALYRLNLCDGSKGFTRWLTGADIGAVAGVATGLYLSDIKSVPGGFVVAAYGVKADRADRLLFVARGAAGALAGARVIAKYGDYELGGLAVDAASGHLLAAVMNRNDPHIDVFKLGDELAPGVSPSARFDASPITRLLPASLGLVRAEGER